MLCHRNGLWGRENRLVAERAEFPSPLTLIRASVRRTAEGLPESPPQWTIIPQELRAAPNSASAHAR